MPAGLQVFNDGGIVQIDENFRNLVFIQKFSFTTAGDHTLSMANRTSPVLVFNSANAGGVAIRSASVSGTTYTWRINGVTDVYVFDVPPLPSAHGQGLQVFTASGQIAFDSGFVPLKLLDYKRVRPSPNLTSFPTQTASTDQFDPNNLNVTSPNTVEVGFPAYTVPAVSKPGFTLSGGTRGWWDTGSHIYRFVAQYYISASRIKVTLPIISEVQGGEYWPGASSAPITSLSLVDLTGL